MHRETVRMGATGRPRLAVAIWIAAAIAAAGALAIALLLWRADHGARPGGAGCEVDADCGAGRLCARGGCFPLARSESARDWRTDLDAMSLAGPSWRPRETYGERLTRAAACPPKAAEANPLAQGKISLVLRTQVIEVRGGAMRIHVQNRMRGALWVEALRFAFPGVRRIDPGRMCASEGVAGISLEEGRPGAVDAALVQSVPAGSVASAALSLEVDLPKPDRDGLRTLEIPLEPAPPDAAIVTVLALPLGTNVARLSGAEPSRQRLLPGFVAYYWRHAAVPGRVSVSFASKVAPGAELALDEVKP